MYQDAMRRYHWEVLEKVKVNKLQGSKGGGRIGE